MTVRNLTFENYEMKYEGFVIEHLISFDCNEDWWEAVHTDKGDVYFSTALEGVLTQIDEGIVEEKSK